MGKRWTNEPPYPRSQEEADAYCARFVRAVQSHLGERLRGAHRLALVSNGASDLQREKLRGAGLEGYFDCVVVSGDIGIGKPDPAPFRRALTRLGVPPDAAAMVGDTLDRDVLGARRAGIRALWLNRSGAPPPDGGDALARPDAWIGGLNQVAALL